MMLQSQSMYQPEGEIAALTEKSFNSAFCVSTNSVDGSVWVAEYTNGGSQVVHLAADGSELWRSGTFASLGRVAVNPADGSCWAVDRIPDTKQLVLTHFAADGSLLWQGAVLTRDCNVGSAVLGVNPADGSVWVTGCGTKQTVHVAKDGTVLQTAAHGGLALAVDPSDGSIWMTDGSASQVVHISSTGTDLGSVAGWANALAVDVKDSSCWTSRCGFSGEIDHYAADGTPLSSSFGFGPVYSLSVNPGDGSCWVGEDVSCDGQLPGGVALLAKDGSLLWSGGSFWHPLSVSANTADGTCWVADTGVYDSTTQTYADSKVVHLGYHILTVAASANPSTVASAGIDDSERELSPIISATTSPPGPGPTTARAGLQRSHGAEHDLHRAGECQRAGDGSYAYRDGHLGRRVGDFRQWQRHSDRGCAGAASLTSAPASRAPPPRCRCNSGMPPKTRPPPGVGTLAMAAPRPNKVRFTPTPRRAPTRLA